MDNDISSSASSSSENKPTVEVQPDELIERLVPDPANPGVKRIVGFRLGRSSQEDLIRLYLTPKLDEYVDIPKVDALDSRTTRDGLGQTIVWVKPETRLTHVRVGSVSYLEGDIQRRFLGGARGLGPFLTRFAVGERANNDPTICVCEITVADTNPNGACPGDSCGLCT